MKRNILFFLTLFSAFVVLFSCQKEYSLQQAVLGSSSGSLKDTTGMCLPFVAHGTLYTGVVPGTDTAYVEIQVRVTNPGTYHITTDEQNGFSYSDSGYFSTAGLNTIHLKPSGTPQFIQETFFTVTYDTSVCAFNVTVLDSTGTGIGGGSDSATGSLKDVSGNCMEATPHGTFYTGITPGADTAYVDVQVNVTKTGSYEISTNNVNGLSFSASGSFSSTGMNTVRLLPIGKLSNSPGDYTFDYSFDTSMCSFTLQVQDSTGTGLGANEVSVGLNEWKFTVNGQTYMGTFSANQLISFTGLQASMIGFTDSGLDTTFGLTVQFPGSIVETGTYTTETVGTNFQLTKTASGDIIYAANALFVPPTTTIQVLSWDETTLTMTGKFSGEAYDFGGNNVTISDGEFKAQFQ